MIKRFDFKCKECDNIQESWVKGNTPSTTCDVCGGEAKRIISPIPTKFAGVGWPGADDKWARDHEKAASKQSS
jgi:putative FmdB family regulatory protein